MCLVGPDAQDPISCMAMDGKAVWTSSGPDVIKYLRGKEVARISNPLGSTLSYFIIFGNQLLALTEDGKRMFVWDTAEGGTYAISSVYDSRSAVTSLAVNHRV